MNLSQQPWLDSGSSHQAPAVGAQQERRSHNLPPTMTNRSLEEEEDANAFELIK
jgi:hypothetical protein